MARARRRVGRGFACSIGCVAALLPAVAQGSLPIFGGPTYSSSVATGASPITLATPGHSAAEGYAVGSATTYDPSTSTTWTPILGYRWNTAGTVENLGNVIVAQPFDEAGDRHVSAIAPDHTAVGYALADSGGFTFPGTFGPPASRAQFWDQSNNVTTLAPLTAFGPAVPVAAMAFGMNRSHVIVGNSEVNQFYGAGSYTNYGTRAVRWDSPTSPATNLGSPSINGFGVALAQASFVNDAGNIAGTYTLFSASNANLGTRAVRWTPGSITPVPLGDYGDDSNGHSTVIVTGQNASGTIVGAAERDASVFIQSSSRVMGAARWDVGSASLVGLGDLSHNIRFHVNAQAYGINDAGTVIGYSVVGGIGFGSGERAVRWEAGSSAPVTLDTFGVSGSGAATARGYAINSSGVSVGFSSRYDGSGTFVANCAAMWLDDASHTIVDLNSYLPANSGWHLDAANDITTAGFITGTGTYDPPGSDAAYQRGFMILVPAAGTYGRGDANFDGHIDFSDLLVLAKHYGQANAAQHIDVGDFDLSGATDFSDLLTLAKHYGTSAASASDLATLPAGVAADWALAQSLVPEPATALVLLAGVGVGFGGRRRSRQRV